jgi:hydrogenase expression/formation protein HypC
MCLAVPVKILRLLPLGKAAVAQGSGELVIDVSLLQDPHPGDHVIVHAGFAIEILPLQEAEERLALFKKMEELMAEDLPT